MARTNFHFLIEKETLGQNDRSACVSMEDFSWFFLYVSPFHVKKHEIRLLINVEGGLFNYLTFVVDPINLRLLLLYGLCRVNRDNLITTLN